MNTGLIAVKVSTFFDRPAVIKRVNRAKLQYLRIAGGRTRLTARRSIRPRKQISLPGNPPNSHTGGLRESILFGLDPQRDAVLVGPTPRLRQRSPGGGLRGASVLEFGGELVGTDSAGKPRKMYYRARPFMGPALDKISPQLPELWKNSVK